MNDGQAAEWLHERWRVTLLREVCDELDARGAQHTDRLEWAALLAQVSG